MFSSIPLSVSRLTTAFPKIRAAHQFCDFEFNLKFAMTATVLYIGQRVHKKSNKKRSEVQWKDRVNHGPIHNYNLESIVFQVKTVKK